MSKTSSVQKTSVKVFLLNNLFAIVYIEEENERVS
jgi:hypothetical protein